MKIQTKITSVNVAIIIILITGMILISRGIIKSSFEGLEKKYTQENLIRFNETKQRNLDTLHSQINDWASWDDTYYFLNNEFPEYAEKNLDQETITNLGVDFILYTNTSGDLFLSYFSESKNKTELERLTKSVIFKINTNDRQTISGIYVVDNQPIILSSSEVFKSDRTGPSNGLLIEGKILDDEALKSIEEQIRLPIKFILKNDLENASGLTQQDYDVQYNKEINIYNTLNDLENTPKGVFRIDIPREIYAQGKSAERLILFNLGLLFTLFIILTLIFNYFLSKKITTPLSDLKKITQEINKGNLNLEFNIIDKKSEVSVLAESIKKMLEKLKESQKDLENKVKERTKELEEKNKELEKFNKLAIGRELKMVELKKMIKKLEKMKGG
jgi:sensor domain CHASE-containing protein